MFRPRSARVSWPAVLCCTQPARAAAGSRDAYQGGGRASFCPSLSFAPSSSAMHRKVNVLFHARCSHLLNPAGLLRRRPFHLRDLSSATQRHQHTNIDEWDTQTQQTRRHSAAGRMQRRQCALLATIAQRSGCEPPPAGLGPWS